MPASVNWLPSNRFLFSKSETVFNSAKQFPFMADNVVCCYHHCHYNIKSMTVTCLSCCRCLTMNFPSPSHALCPGLPGWAGTRKVKPIWILLKQETVSGSGISWAICKSASRSRQPCQHPTTQFFYRPDALSAAQPTASKHWRHPLSEEQ